MSKPTVTARELRDYFNADPKRLAGLSERARHTVEYVDGKSPRGQVHPEAVALHNKRRKVAYVRGTTGEVKAQRKAEAVALREQARAAGYEVGARGPLPKAFKESLTSK